jgi:hypothetical protein
MAETNTPRQPRLTPGAITEELFCLVPDRDERAPQLCAETLLTLVNNSYRAPSTGKLISPKRQQFALRSLALGENFLGGRDDGRAGDDETTPAEYGASLAAGRDVHGSSYLSMAHQALQGLIDPETQRGSQPGAWLLRPFHETLLWYDARKASTKSAEYTVRKVYMRGSGITLARLLVDPAVPEVSALAGGTVSAIRHALTTGGPLATISHQLEGALPPDSGYTRPPGTEADEQAAWDRGASSQLAELTRLLCRHANGVMLQREASGPARLWQLRTILALDFATHLIRTAWRATATSDSERYLLLSFGEGPRPDDPVRQRSEESHRRARIRLNEAIVRTLARRMQELADAGPVNWPAEFLFRRGRQSDDTARSISTQLKNLESNRTVDDYLRIARETIETADYSRGAEGGFRVLLESVGALAGTGGYRYLTAGPDLLAALVGALSAQMPMSSRDFFAAVRTEWGLVINQESAVSTVLAEQLDGAGLERNARKAERLMSDAGLAVGLSDRTTMVGERAARVA